MSEGGQKAGRGRPAEKGNPNSGEAIAVAPQATKILAQQFSVAHSLISEAKRVRQDSPELFTEIKEGKLCTRTAVERVPPEQKSKPKRRMHKTPEEQKAMIDKLKARHGKKRPPNEYALAVRAWRKLNPSERGFFLDMAQTENNYDLAVRLFKRMSDEDRARFREFVLTHQRAGVMAPATVH